MYMSEMDFPGRLYRYGADDFSFQRIALQKEDTYVLPSFDAKTDDARCSWYVSRYGIKAWELDAMDPEVLSERVEYQILGQIDSHAWERYRMIEDAERETTKMVAALPELRTVKINVFGSTSLPSRSVEKQIPSCDSGELL